MGTYEKEKYTECRHLILGVETLSTVGVGIPPPPQTFNLLWKIKPS